MMTASNQQIPNTIKRHLTKEKLLTIATCRDNIPYCTHCFYCYWEDQEGLIIKSHEESLHIQNSLSNPNVSGTITFPIKNILSIKGIHFSGEFEKLSKKLLNQADWLYHKRFPLAMTFSGSLWFIKLNYLKLIDKSSFNHPKITWSLNELNQEVR